MIALDTSLLARLILGDNTLEERLAARAIAEQQCSISWTVLMELCWVLERSAKLPKGEIIAALNTIAAFDAISVPDKDALAWALSRYAEGADFPDMVHLVTSAPNCSAFVTLDRKLERQAGENPPLPISTLRA